MMGRKPQMDLFIRTSFHCPMPFAKSGLASQYISQGACELIDGLDFIPHSTDR